MPIITLTTDFGTKDPFAGIMKGVILSINPQAQIVDLTHEISPQDIKEAAFILGNAWKYFPPKTIHVAVVDPGVGSERRHVIVKSKGQFFLGPDNGIFTPFLKGAEKVVQIGNKKYLLPIKGPTFHGRDVFAPAAAWLSKGIPLLRFGREIKNPVILELPQAKQIKNSIKGQIVHIDSFGNCISNISTEIISRLKGKPLISIKNRKIALSGSYSEKPDEKPHALINSDGFLEIFLFKGNAARKIGIKKGYPIKILIRNPS